MEGKATKDMAIGLHDIGSEGDFTWVDGVSEKSRYENWWKGEPNGVSIF